MAEYSETRSSCQFDFQYEASAPQLVNESLLVQTEERLSKVICLLLQFLSCTCIGFKAVAHACRIHKLQELHHSSGRFFLCIIKISDSLSYLGIKLCTVTNM